MKKFFIRSGIFTVSYYPLRYVFFLSIIFLFSSRLYSQEVRIGASGVSQFFLDSEETLFTNATGGSVCAELAFNNSFGESVRFQYEKLFTDEHMINSAQQISMLLGLWGRMPFAADFIFLQPSIEAGIVYQMVELSGESSMPDEAYTDFIMQIGLGVRFVPVKLMKGKIDFEIAPVYTIIPMSDKVFQYAGARLSIFYVFK